MTKAPVTTVPMTPDSTTIVYYEDLHAGEEFWSAEFPVLPDEMLDYNRRFDPWPMHVDEAAAQEGPFGGLIASGGYTLGLMYRSGHSVYKTPQNTWALQAGLDWKVRFLLPVRANDRLRNRITIRETRLSSQPGRGVVVVLNEMVNQDSRVVLSCEMVLLLATRGTAGEPAPAERPP